MNDLKIPPQLGEYEILREVGAGGMGTVFEARRKHLGKPVALKVLPLGGFSSSRLRARFRIESQAMAQLDHPHIVPVWDVGCEQGYDYFVMQLINGANVAKLISGLRHWKSHGVLSDTSNGNDETLALSQSPSTTQFVLQTPSPNGSTETVNVSELLSTHASSRNRSSARYVRTIVDMVMRVADALHHAHELQIVHRDVKPSNLLLDQNGHVWLSDFGLARMGDETSLTMDGDLLGTVRYMSPEQAMARVTVDHRTDIYSLGATLYELLTLDPAHPGRDRPEILQKVMFADPIAPSRIDPTIPGELSTITMKALAKSPDERYQTAQEMSEDLRAYLEDRPIKAQPPSVGQRVSRWIRRHRQLAASLASGGALAICGLAIALTLAVAAQNRIAQALENEKQAKAKVETALNKSEGLRKAAQASIVVDEDPGRARSLAEEALQQYASVESRNALLTALDEGHEIRTIRPEGRVIAGDISADRARGVTITETGKDDPRRQLTLWDMRDSKIDRQLKAPATVEQAFFCSDGVRLISISSKETGFRPVMWDALSGKPIWPPSDETELWTAPAFRPRSLNSNGDGALIRDTRKPNETVVLDLIGRRPKLRLPCQAPVKLSLFLAEDRIATADADGKVTIWDNEGEKVTEIQAPRRHANSAIQVDDIQLDRKSNTLLLVASATVTVWNAGTGERILDREWNGRAAAWLNQGREFVVLSNLAPRMSIHNRLTGRTMHRIRLENLDVFAVSPDQAAVVASKANHEAGIWNAMTGEAPHSIQRRAPIGKIRFIDSEYLVSQTSRDVTLWHRLPGAARQTLALGAASETRPLITFAPDGPTKNHPVLATSTVETGLLSQVDKEEAPVRFRGAPRGAGVSTGGYLATVVAPEETGLLWKINSSSPIARWPLPEGGWTSLHCSHDGHWMGGIIDSVTGVFRSVQEGAQWESPGTTLHLNFHPDQPRAVTVNEDADVFIWDLEKEIASHRFTTDQPLRGPQFLTESENLIAIHRRQVVRLDYEGNIQWASTEISPQALYVVESMGRVVAVHLFPKARFEVLDLETGKSLATHSLPKRLNYVAVATDQPVIAAASEDGVGYWNYESDAKRQLFEKPASRVAIGGNRVYTLTQFASDPFRWKNANQNVTSEMFELEMDTGDVLRTWPDSERRIMHLMPTHDEEIVLIAQKFGWTRFHPTTLKIQTMREDHAAPVSDLVALSKRSELVLSSWDGSISIYDQRDRLVRKFGQKESPILDLDVDERNDRLATGTVDGRVIVWKLDGAKVDETEPHSSPVIAVKWGNNGSRLSVLYKDGRAKILHLRDNQIDAAATAVENATSLHLSPVSSSWFLVKKQKAMHELVLHFTQRDEPGDDKEPLSFSFPRIRDAKMSPTGDHLAVIDDQGEIQLMGTVDGKVAHRLKGQARIQRLVFSPSGQYLLAHGPGIDPEIWNVKTGQQHVLLRRWGSMHISKVETAARTATLFSPDGKFIFTMRGKDRRVRMWPLELAEAAQQMAPFE